jgi:hypothetical protein
MKKTAAAIILILAVLIISCQKHVYPASVTGEVTLNNAPLEAAIRAQIGKPTGALTEMDLENLTYLNISASGITSLSGIENCKNLKVLYMWDNSVTDLSPLASLTNLQCLCAMHNNISSVAPLANMTYLRNLDLAGNNISDVSPLAPGCVPHGIGNHMGDELDLSSNPLSAQAINTDIPCIEAGAVSQGANTNSTTDVEVVILNSSNDVVRSIEVDNISQTSFSLQAPVVIGSGDALPSNSSVMIKYWVAGGISWDIRDYNDAWAMTGNYRIQLIARPSTDVIFFQESNAFIINSDSCGGNLHPCTYGGNAYDFP